MIRPLGRITGTTASAQRGPWAYPSYREFLAQRFPGQHIRKLCLHAGFTCPNIDGSVSRGGCSYCNNEGFAPQLVSAGNLQRQWDRGRDALRRRHRRVHGFIAYFQSFSGTYASVEQLRQIYDQVPGAFDECVGMSIGTRPDCVPDPVLAYCAELSQRLPHFTLEMGLQSDRDEVLRAINRGHDVDCFLDAVARAAAHKISLCAHVILGLPHEGDDAPERLGRLLAGLPVQFIKIHNFHVMAGTPLERAFERGVVSAPERARYVTMAARLIAELRPDQYLQRVLADAPAHILRSGAWCHDKQGVLSDLRQAIEFIDG
ncbi:MAG: TIGR01212 family radical SAM protein [Planctomycetota bacterium]|jgi:radical SAM protein (TIGR01212 family)|nr:TIGR01212 family radical SAM protein [Planctomycetota bacterium]